MLHSKRSLSIFIISFVAIITTLYFRSHKTWEVVEVGRINHRIVHNFGFSPDGKTIVSFSNRKVTLWNLRAEQIQTLSSGRTNAYKWFAFSPNGHLIVTASNTELALWNTQGKQLWTSPFAINRPSTIPDVPVVSFHPSGKMIAAIGYEKVKLWNLDGEEIQTLRHKGVIRDSKFSLDGQMMVTISNQEVKLWNLPGDELEGFKTSDLTHSLKASIKGSGFFEYVEFSPNGKTIITVDKGNVSFWSQNGKLLKSLSTLMAGSALPNSNNTAILTPHPDGARLWNYEGKLLAFFKHELLDGSRGQISWGPDHQIFATAGSRGVRLWNVKNGTIIQALPKLSLLDQLFHNTDANHLCDSVSFSANGQIIAAVCEGTFGPDVIPNGLRVWSRDGKLLWIPDEIGYDEYVFGPDSQTLVVKHKGQLVLLKLRVKSS